jgi:hypothetical protein
VTRTPPISIARAAPFRVGVAAGIAAALTLCTGEALSRSFDGGIDVETRVGADSVTVGERLHVVHRITYPDSLTLVPPESFDLGTCRLMSIAWKEEKKGARITKTASLDVVTTDLEKASLPGMELRFLTQSGDTLTGNSDGVEVPVRRLTGEKSEPKPLKPQWEAPRSYLFLLYIAGALALAALAYWLIRKWRRRPAPRQVEPELPDDFVALRRLNEIERMNLLEAGDFKTHYTLVVDALRAYMERRYAILALDETTDEILWNLRRLRVDAADIEPILREADLVKFAKVRPETSVARRLIDSVRGIIARTALRPLAEESAERAETAGGG